MVESPVVSVIIPAYNRAAFLPKAVESVLNQTLKNVEVIVVDDGSTDYTKAALEPFKGKIRYIFTGHKGQSYARNAGMKSAAGEYIAFLDSDDTYLPLKLEAEVSFMRSHPDVGLVFTEFSAVGPRGFFQERHLKSYHPYWNRLGYAEAFPVSGEFRLNGFGKNVHYYIGDLFPFLLKGFLISSFTVLFPKKALETAGFQNEKYGMAEDFEFTLRLCKHYKAGFLDIPTYVYRYHDGQLTPVLLLNQFSRRETALKHLEICRVVYGAVKNLAYKDPAFYAGHAKMIRARLAGLSYAIGKDWLEYGNVKKARRCFKRCFLLEGPKALFRNYIWVSWFPAFFRRLFFALRGLKSGMVKAFMKFNYLFKRREYAQ